MKTVEDGYGQMERYVQYVERLFSKMRRKMMKSMIEFLLPEENNELKLAMDGAKLFSCLWDIDQHIRGCMKHGHEYKDIDEALQSIRDIIWEHVNFDDYE